MYYHFGSKTNAGLVKNLAQGGIIKTSRVEHVMSSVDRALFVPRAKLAHAYEDNPLGIGYAATISAPHMHAHALDLLEPYLHEGAHALDVGSGSGYLVACMAQMVGPTGVVVGIEHIPELVAMGRAHLEAWNPDVLRTGQAVCIMADGRKGFPEHAPYHAIHVGAAAPEIPADLVAQLARPGRMIIPVGPQHGFQELVQVDKDVHGNVTSKELLGVRYVPLTSKEAQLGA
ncbi:hypothetical protein H9P43_002701 [Blastocladiella emersonii ATCC 22665]|nr:hypothetical protein H9P43_002701 [Blastocladiella emersonii ATCC 22665]